MEERFDGGMNGVDNPSDEFNETSQEPNKEKNIAFLNDAIEKTKKLNYYHNEKTNKSILNIALHVNMVHKGSSDCYESYFKDVSFLKYALSIWNYEKYTKFDSAVKDLIEAALEGCSAFIDEMGLYAEYSVMCRDPEYFLKK